MTYFQRVKAELLNRRGMVVSGVITLVTAPRFLPELAPPVTDPLLSSANLLVTCVQLGVLGAVGIAIHVSSSAMVSALPSKKYPAPTP